VAEGSIKTHFNPVLSPFSGFQETRQRYVIADEPEEEVVTPSVGSISSIGSAGSILSIGSAGSILSIGSAGSVLSIGSAGSVLSIGSIGSVGSIGSAFSIGALGGFGSGRPRVVDAVATVATLAALVAALRG
jgi:hypothetical protein